MKGRVTLFYTAKCCRACHCKVKFIFSFFNALLNQYLTAVCKLTLNCIWQKIHVPLMKLIFINILPFLSSNFIATAFSFNVAFQNQALFFVHKMPKLNGLTNPAPKKHMGHVS
jgi:hypothetical protein